MPGDDPLRPEVDILRFAADWLVFHSYVHWMCCRHAACLPDAHRKRADIPVSPLWCLAPRAGLEPATN